MYAIAHATEEGIVIDLEPVDADGDEMLEGALRAQSSVKRAVSHVQDAFEKGAYFQSVTDELRALLGYDRVMLYRFHEDDHGEVVAETARIRDGRLHRAERIVERIAADYDAILRYFGSPGFKAAYVPRVLVKMRVGGESNQSLRKILLKSREDYRALRRSGVGGLGTLACKNLSKIGQFIGKP